MKLKGKKLQILDIHRKGIFDMDAMVFCCDNCGRAIVNSATVRDEGGNVYVIGLDCKRTLIDKPHIETILSDKSRELWHKQDVKDYKRKQKDIVDVMKYLDNPERYQVRCIIYGNCQDLVAYDLKQQDNFGNYGATIYSKSIGYLFSIGLENVLKAAVTKGIIKKA